MKRSSKAVWKGSGKGGSGYLTSQSLALNKVPYTWNSRFENKSGTNPEELIAAAHAGCFTMKLSFLIGEAGFTPDIIETTAEILLEQNAISQSHLIVKAKIPGISKQKFEECATNAKDNCPVSKLLNATITMETALTEEVAV